MSASGAVSLGAPLKGWTGYAVTGGQDTVVNVFALPSTKGEPNFSLLGHTDNVCTLHTAEDGTIISGSWDKCVLLPSRHSAVTVCRVTNPPKNREGVEGLPATIRPRRPPAICLDRSGYRWRPILDRSVALVSIARALIDGGTWEGSADNTIKLWKQHKNVRTYPGHTQAVRGLALITDIGFASCSNDRYVVGRFLLDIGLDLPPAAKSGSGPWKATACIRYQVTRLSSTAYPFCPMATSCQVERTGQSASGEVRIFYLSHHSPHQYL